MLFLKTKNGKITVNYQSKVFNNLIHRGKNTVFGKDHDFSSIKSYDDFKKEFPFGGMKVYQCI